MSCTDFDTYGECPKCDYSARLSFNDLFYLHVQVCPNCGTDKGSFKKVVKRWVPKKKVFIDAHWEYK